MASFLKQLFTFHSPQGEPEELPLRAEIFSVERLEQYAQTLAREHKIILRKGRPQLLPRLEENGRKLEAAYRTLVDSISEGRAISPAGEWLVDNHHIVEEQLREIRQDLPKGYYQELPKLVGGPLEDYPRIYAVALALIAHTDSRLDTNTLRRFISSYQTVAPLTIGELWAVAITLRLALVENLRRLAVAVIGARAERDEADKLADKLLELVSRQPAGIMTLVQEKLGKREHIPQTLVVQLVQRLREQHPSVMPVMDWLEKELAGPGTNIEQIIHAEHQRQAAAQVTVGNIITSMRLLSTLDWQEFFEKVSLIDPLLGKDPARAYSQMEFASRDRYRHVIERISKRTRVSEIEIAQAVVKLASKASAQPENHVGYYLEDDGLQQLENLFEYRPRTTERILRFFLRNAPVGYPATLAILTVLVIVLILVIMYQYTDDWRFLLLSALLAILPASEIALTVLNWDVTHFFPPRLLARMNTAGGIPKDAQTFVVVPTIFTNEQQVEHLLERLEVHYLANRDHLIYFGLLGDFADAKTEETTSDSALLARAQSGIEDLNGRHGGNRFHLFHRKRIWNEREGKWMGWERKRGKLEEFNRLLRGSNNTTFIVRSADNAFLNSFRYVITLDSDTQLPRDAARKLIGAAIHPLNRPKINPNINRVTYGYGILQPRVSISLESASHSRFARVFSGNTGIDPYTTAVSDVYQDLFGEGSFTGKGLYDVDAFQATLEQRAPENTLLSHDLFESLFARAALTTEIELLDDYPSSYQAYAKRQHRWTRGDWQIVRWLFPRVPEGEGAKVSNRLPLIARWKIFDNLRRSLVGPALFIWLLASWLIFPGSPLGWSLFVLLTIAFPIYLHVATGLLVHPRGIPWTSHFWSLWGDVRINTAQVALSFALLPHQAYLMCDAIVRSLYRQFISHRNLLEWVSAADIERSLKQNLPSFFQFMLSAEVLTLIALALAAVYRPAALPVIAVPAFVWILSPVIAYLISKPIIRQTRLLTGPDVEFSRAIARAIWRFFETFVTPEENWLPPDNYQEDPVAVIAHRTSPTNIGLLLLATCSAKDLGYVSSLELVERQELTFGSLGKLARLHGHFFNWYDTLTLEPLLPQYISTVDSGNLAGHLIAVKQANIELPDLPLFDDRVIAGFADTVDAIGTEASRLGSIRQRTDVVTVRQLQDEISACRKLLANNIQEDLPAWFLLIDSLHRRASEIDDIINALSHEHGEVSFKELRWWVGALQHQTTCWRRDADTLCAWGRLLPLLSAAKETDSSDQGLASIIHALLQVPKLAEIPTLCDNALVQLAVMQQSHTAGPLSDLITRLTRALEQSSSAAGDLLPRLSRLARTCDQIVEEMDFKFLFDDERKLFPIGYNVTSNRVDDSYYDLLASEARLASFVAIAKGDVPQEHWFRMGRPLTTVSGGRALISWTGTMFEYLMPLLVMRNYEGTLLDETYRAVVRRQIEYGEERGVPWGISESAYNVRDLQLNYQYGPFGVPGLGLKRGLIEDVVVAPYATLLAAEIDVGAALKNLRALVRQGALGPFGFYESIDYTPERLPEGQKRAVIKTFMTHHQGMSFVTLLNVLQAKRMEARFHSDPAVQATELLLQERIPIGVPTAHPRSEEVLTGRVAQTAFGMIARVYDSPTLDTPRTQLLSNGTYSVMITTAGAGYSQCGERSVTRWREDVTCDNWGAFIYLRDVRSGDVWSAGHQPIRKRATAYRVAFSEDKADFRRVDSGITTRMEVVVSAEDNAEIRRVSLTNNSTRVREIELTSYSEIVLASPQADAAHPAFSNLFIETEFVSAENAILARRRQGSADEEQLWGIHVVVAEGESVGAVQYETDRGRFLGRGRTPANPIAVMEDRPLSNTTGAVLDPVFSLRRRLRIDPGSTVTCSFTTGVAHSREQALALADKYHDPNIFERELQLAWTKAQVEMAHLQTDAEEAHLFQRLAARIIYSDPSLRPRPHVLALNTKSQSSLWAHGISGDLPIVVVRIEKSGDLQTVRKVVRGHEYLHFKGLKVDLVILNDSPSSYQQQLHRELETMIRTGGLQSLQDKPGGIYLRQSDQMAEADRILLHAVARAVIVTERGSLQDQLERSQIDAPLPPRFVARAAAQTYPEHVVGPSDLAFFNGLGGFHQGGREYVIVLGSEQWTPLPWANVIGNQAGFGFQVTETGGGYSWSINSRENRLTPWSNDPISDPSGEAIYIRDEESGSLWSTTALPIREKEPYLIRHGQGYSVFEHGSHGISQELLVFAPLEAEVKVSLLRLRNRTARKRKVSITSYNELVLGVMRHTSAPYIITEIDQANSMIFSRNPFNNEFAERVAFACTSEPLSSGTCDRKEFIGRNGSLEKPAAMRRANLSNRDGAGLDPCAALQVVIELAPHETREVTFLLGEANSKESANELATKFRQPGAVNAAFEKVLSHWDQVLSTIEVKTPDGAFDTMLNRWLLYQALSCRVWARTAFYQSGGAYGFRDQLQDVMSLVYSRPDVAREQIVLTSHHQFKEGDVQHWWHPPSGRGVRTHISDDLLWLPFVASFYERVTGDSSVFDEVVPYLEQPLLGADEHDRYMEPSVSGDTGNIYDHCVRAIEHSLAVGQHGLPLMGSGDWNDGMNRVGQGGKGESVWLGWFLYTTLAGFIPIVESRNDKERSERYRRHMERLQKALEEKGWDGDWYRRAYFDDGSPLGSAQNEECRIDSIAQSWAVISGASDQYRMTRAMAAVEEYLIRRGDGLVILFTPPFDKGRLDPGYIKGYVPGVRENGGQYTHAALWTLIAFSMLGDGERAGELFSLLNPINHSSTRAGLHKYKVEPYVAVGDVYAVPPHTGRGGWTWYTGSAGWMYRAGLESILGFQLKGDKLTLDPCVPRWWREFAINYRRGRSIYAIKVENPLGLNKGIVSLEVDGVVQEGLDIALTDDQKQHNIKIVMGEKWETDKPVDEHAGQASR
ncbi:MAG TPA: glucoamylase family protein [Pyrinomonadaceae bacterium]|nr:glucoamylase family protein [Pyrinomonadaceae bacterium]